MSLFNLIKSRVSILDVVNEYTTLKKTGSLYWKSPCPFHHEKTPSFTVSPDKGIYYCFGCHAHGDVISFIASKENMSQFQAVQYLIEKYAIIVPQELLSQTPQTTKEEKEKYFDLCKALTNWFVLQLEKHPQAGAYLKDRAINSKSINTFHIGFFPKNSLPELLSYLTPKGFSSQDLLAVSILGQNNTGLYSSFEHRIIFPIRDHIGRFCGFGGRIFAPGDERVKYYNSKENPFFHKGSLLFGLDQAKHSMQKHNAACLVEGYTDTIAMHQYGYTNTVATLGTACTLEHIQQISRYTSRLFVIFDGDQAGMNAMLRIAKLCWQVDIDIQIVQLPAGYDPATYLEEHRQDFAAAIKQAQNIFSFYVMHKASQFDQKNLKEKMQASHEILELIQHMQDPLKQDILLLQASEVLQIPLDVLRTQKTTVPTQTAPHNPLPQEKSIQDSLERQILAILLSKPQLCTNQVHTLLGTGLEEAYVPLFDYISHELKKNSAVTADELQQNAPTDLAELIYQLLLSTELEQVEPHFAQLLLQFQKKHWKTIVGNIKIKLQTADKLQAEQLLQDFQNLKSHLLKSGHL